MFETLALDRPALPEWMSQGDRIDRITVLERQIARLQAEQATEIVTYASATRGVAGERGVAAEVGLARGVSTATAEHLPVGEAGEKGDGFSFVAAGVLGVVAQRRVPSEARVRVKPFHLSSFVTLYARRWRRTGPKKGLMFLSPCSYPVRVGSDPGAVTATRAAREPRSRQCTRHSSAAHLPV